MSDPDPFDQPCCTRGDHTFVATWRRYAEAVEHLFVVLMEALQIARFLRWINARMGP